MATPLPSLTQTEQPSQIGLVSNNQDTGRCPIYVTDPKIKERLDTIIVNFNLNLLQLSEAISNGGLPLKLKLKIICQEEPLSVNKEKLKKLMKKQFPIPTLPKLTDFNVLYPLLTPYFNSYMDAFEAIGINIEIDAFQPINNQLVNTITLILEQFKNRVKDLQAKLNEMNSHVVISFQCIERKEPFYEKKLLALANKKFELPEIPKTDDLKVLLPCIDRYLRQYSRELEATNHTFVFAYFEKQTKIGSK